MKTLLVRSLHFIPATIVAALVAGCWPHIAAAETPPAPVGVETSPAPTPPATPVVPPPNIVPGSPYAEVVRLTQAGVDQSIILTYVTNCTSLFNLDAGKIIYLSDLGAPNGLVTAMMQHDQQLQQQFAANQAAQPAPPAPPAEVVPAPETTPTNTAEVSPAPEPTPVTMNYFYDTLSPYGNWVVINGYGRCWRPTVCVYNSGWQPYCDNGHWVYTDCGWYWASSYAWGATFHYGRWFRDASVGWCWYPDTMWAPSWVTWRYSNNYCGWAPLPPRTTCQAGVGILYNGGNVSVGFGFGLGANCYTFVPTPYFCNPHPRHYCVAPAQLTQVYNHTTVINNYNLNNRTIVNHGIAVDNIAVAAGAPIRPVPVHQMNSTVANGGQSQSFNRSGYVLGANHQTHPRDFGSPLRTPGSAQGYPPQPNHNWITTHAAPPQSTSVPNQAHPEHNPVVATAPQHPAPVADYHPYLPAAPVQTAPVNHNPSIPQPVPSQWQPTETPRNMTRNYQPPQNYNRPPTEVAPQPAAPARVPASSQSQPGGYQPGGYQQPGGNHYWGNGNQNWPGH